MPQRRGLGEGDRQLIQDLRAHGFTARVIYDIGAACGGWTRAVMQACPDAEYHLFEPLANHREDYRRELGELAGADAAHAGTVRLHAVALGETNETVHMAMTDDGVGSSVHRVASVASQPVAVPLVRLDDYAAKHALAKPDIVKMDVQASEDAILRGMGDLVDHAQVLIIETWLRRCYGPKTPLLTELVATLRERGFTFVRVIDEYYNDLHELLAMDAVFVRRELLERMHAAPGELIERTELLARG